MAVAALIVRNAHTESQGSSEEYCTLSLTGTYATGGFTLSPFNISGGLGSSPLIGKMLRAAFFISPLGYIYTYSLAGNVMTVKILTAPNTELANGTAVPDASVNVIFIKSKA